jgi:hypothetical protein|tara:strand:+ start:227 stop:451 length:225 start_codon:yes stop_codon:yes gene_type:complete
MERGPLLEILNSMVGTNKELSIMFYGKDNELEVMDVEHVEKLTSSQGIHLKTKSNKIWIDSSHVSAAWQVRDDI